MKFNHILISRTDSIGDVILTLPLVGLLRKSYPDSKISFLGMPYTREIIESCIHIDQFIDWNRLKNSPLQEAVSEIKSLNVDLFIHVFPRKQIAKIAKLAGIPVRMGTTGRFYHWLTCNKLVRISRRKSDLHEALLNIKLAESIHGFKVSNKEPTNVDENRLISPESIESLYGLVTKPVEDSTFGGLVDKSYINVILHPRSKGSAREWGPDNFAGLANRLNSIEITPGKPKYRVYVTGTSAEGEMLRKEGFFNNATDIIDVTGKFNLQQFIQFINSADALVAGSTGPLHIAAALGKIAIGLYPPIRPMHPGRWAPLGKRATYLVAEKECNRCRKSNQCECMQLITIDQVQQKLEGMVSNNV